MRQYMVTTMDNPFNPFKEYGAWLAWDRLYQHRTGEIFGFYAKVSNELNDEDYDEEANEAFLRMTELNPYGMYMKVYEDEADILIPLANKAYKETFSEMFD